jgi:CDP-glucose 4,6-dehydratase
VTRCGNFFGGGDLNWNRIVPGKIKSLLRREAPVIRSDGTFVRDYFYVLDAVHAYLALAERMDDESLWGEAFNFSNELQITVLDLVRRLGDLMGCTDIEPRVLSEAQSEIPHQYLSAAKARRVLGWKPAWELDQGLRETITWYTDWFASPRARFES